MATRVICDDLDDVLFGDFINLELVNMMLRFLMPLPLIVLNTDMHIPVQSVALFLCASISVWTPEAMFLS